ncbi:MAG: thermonuclease family protein [Chthoniobacteraceae bacterium]
MIITIVTLAAAWYRGGGDLDDLLPRPAQKRASSKEWERLDGCRFLPHSGNDGDSFHVVHQGKEYIFRLYFVDAPESDDTYGERTAAQAKYFGITSAEAVKLGESARTFTRKRLERGKFTVWTRWRDALGRSKLPRYYAMVKVGDNDLGELLVSNGLVRIYGTRVALPDGRDSRTYLRILDQLEQEAKGRRLGGWRAKRTAFLSAAPLPN